MATVIDRIALTHGGWRHRHSALHLAVKTAKDCLELAGRAPQEVDLLINAGIYRDRNLGEPALAAMIQQDVGANPEDPHEHAHGTFSFDIANGTCGILTALQVVDGFLKSHAIDCALVVASDADPGRGMSDHFPFSPAGAALLCDWTDDDFGLEHIHWTNIPDGGEDFSATVGLIDGTNVLRFDQSATADQRFAHAAAEAVDRCLDEASLTLSDIDAIVAAPARGSYRAALAARLGVPEAKIIAAKDEAMHTASLAAALDRAIDQLPLGGRILIISAGAGITAGAAIYRQPPARHRVG
jgi:3-oxoacyl-[acyl-carrier-protein] synthase III